MNLTSAHDIHAIRAAYGMTLQAFAQRLGVAATTVWGWERYGVHLAPLYAQRLSLLRQGIGLCVRCHGALPMGSLRRTQYCSVACAMPEMETT